MVIFAEAYFVVHPYFVAMTDSYLTFQASNNRLGGKAPTLIKATLFLQCMYYVYIFM